jgi:hypothetical protein
MGLGIADFQMDDPLLTLSPQEVLALLQAVNDVFSVVRAEAVAAYLASEIAEKALAEALKRLGLAYGALEGGVARAILSAMRAE